MCLTVDKVAPSSDALTDQQTERRQIAQAGKRQFLNSAVHRQCNHNTDDRTVNRNAALPDGDNLSGAGCNSPIQTPHSKCGRR